MVPKMKITPDCYLSCLQACTCPADAVTLFKRLCKTVTSSSLLSRNPGIDATEDVALYFEEVFAQTDVTLSRVFFSVQQCHDFPCPEIVEFFSASNVCRYFPWYPSAVSCESDSIHVRILKALLPFV
ncbi:hypothetical protein DSO57_1032763 [Entomophthora muscae]|uniref:Uncharacterized protein n=1 Tax=Entomophthora muscae TaxID=34485 RepID=A0ACC2TB70_9FUNG|nr:hypothetical protein DSO57_1032763 [Entomophthora muscae]